MADNPFDALDDAVPESATPLPVPSLGERFSLNFEAGQRFNTVLGAASGATSADRVVERLGFEQKYQRTPGWESWTEGAAALAGQIAGTAASPENFLPIGLGEKIVVGSKMAVSALWAKVFAGAVDAAAVNAAADLAIQGIEMDAGVRDGFDAQRYFTGVLLGAGIGGVAGGAGHLLETRAAAKAGRAAAEAAPTNPFDALDQGAAEATAKAETAAPKISPEAAAPPKADAAPDAAAKAALPEPAPKGDATPAEPPAIGDALAEKAAEVHGTGPFGPDHPIGGVEIRAGREADGKVIAQPAMSEAAARNFAEQPMPAFSPDNFRFFSARELQVDARRFQFKEGGDAAGVTDRLKGVTEWKPERAGVTVVWEDDNGRLFVADGHQRAGLARRIGQATGQDVRLPGYVFRAADGFTAEDVRVAAALKNIAEGTGSAVDAAKVLRTGRLGVADTGLPPSLALVRDAAGLARLSDDAFAMAVNGVVDPKLAAVAGRLANDERLHAQLLQALKDADARSIGEAESIVKDLLAEPVFTETQMGLFGENELARLLVKEKAQVRQAALKSLKNDRQVFKRLVEEENRIASAGNVLDTAANTERMQGDALLIEAIDSLSRTRGTIADALDAAARAVAGGKRAAGAAQGFVELVRAEIERAGGNLGRVGDSRPSTLIDPALAGSRAAEPAAARNFAEAVHATATVSEFLDMAAPAALTGQRGRAAAGVAAKAVDGIARVRDTAEALASALDVAATRQGRMTGKASKLGQYGVRSGVVRVRSLDDFDTLTHEFGHAFEAKSPAAKAFVAANRKELKGLDYDPAKGRAQEGFAELVRLWVTNRAFAEKQHPALAAAFKAMLGQEPEAAKAFDAAAKAWSGFISAPSSAAVASTIVSGRKGGWLARAGKAVKDHGVTGTIADTLQRLYMFTLDDLGPLNRAVAYLKDLHFDNTGRTLDIDVTADPYKLARMSRGAWSAGHMDVMYGVAPYRSMHPSSPSLRDAIIEATSKPNALARWDEAKVRDFGAYLWSRRALGEWDRFDQGLIPNPPDKLTKGDHALNVTEMEAANPQFVPAAQKVHEFGRALWTKKRDAGLIDQQTYLEGLAITDYVPGLRDFSREAETTGRDRKGARGALGGMVRRFKGSKRDVVNPLESLAGDAYETAMAIARNDVAKTLHRLALDAGPGGGAIAEIVPAKQLTAKMVDPLQAVESAARNAGLAKADIVMLRDAVESAVGQEKAAVFRPAAINAKGEPIVFFRDGGELKALRLADGRFGRDLYRAMTAMAPVEKNFFIEMLALPARALRFGATTAIEFIGANFVRDQAMASLFYGKPLMRIGRTLQGAADDLLGREAAVAYNRVGGLSGGQETASLAAAFAERDLSALKRKGWLTQRLTSWRGLLKIAETSETATRVGLFRTFREEAAKRGLDEYEAAMEAAWRARDYIDFDRRGAVTTAINRIVPFFNVALQGLDKASRQMIAPLARKYFIDRPLSGAEAREVADAMSTWMRLAALTVAGMSLHALMKRHEDYDEISTQTRATHWMVKAGEKWIAIPKPFEMAVALNLGEAAFDAMAAKDPTAWSRWLDSVMISTAPPSVMEGNPTLRNWFEVRTNTDLRTGGPIVPENLQGMEPFLQFTARTSDLAKTFGRWFGVSPMVAEHVFVSHTASWGRTLLSLYDMAQPDAPAFAWDDAPIARRFIKDAAKGATSTRQFWAMVGEREGELTGKARTYQALGESERADYYARQDEISRVFIAADALPAKAKRMHPLVNARNGVQAIGVVRREMAENRLRGPDGDVLAISPAARTAADDVLSSLAMAMARNALTTVGVAGWAQREPMDEDGFYRELEAIDPRLADTLGALYAEKKVWRADAVATAWPEFRARVLADGAAAALEDLRAEVEAEGRPLDGAKRPKKKKARPGG